MHDPEEYSLLNLPRSAHAEFMHRLDKAIVMHGDYADQIRSIKAITLKQPVVDPEKIFAKIRETDSVRGVSFADTHPEVARLIGYE